MPRIARVIATEYPHLLFFIIFILLPLAAGAAQPPKTLPESGPKYRAVETVFNRLLSCQRLSEPGVA
jgi:hypothetical protein